MGLARCTHLIAPASLNRGYVTRLVNNVLLLALNENVLEATVAAIIVALLPSIITLADLPSPHSVQTQRASNAHRGARPFVVPDACRHPEIVLSFSAFSSSRFVIGAH